MTEAAVSEATTPTTPEGGDSAPARSLASDAWRTMRGNPLFWVSAVLIVIFTLMAIFPSLFTSTNRPRRSSRTPACGPTPTPGSVATSRATTSTPAASTARARRSSSAS